MTAPAITSSTRPRGAKAAAWTVLCDSREQQPWRLQPLIDQHELPFRLEVAALRSGDYALREAPHVVVERKSLQDLVGCVGYGRERFERELGRLQAEARHAFVIVEASVHDVELHAYRGVVTPPQVLGTVLGWQLSFDVQVLWAGSADTGAALALRLFGIVRSRMLRAEAAEVRP